MRPFEERLWGRIDKTGEGGCWLWTRACNAAGYGAVGRDKKVLLVHRVVYELLVGPIPEGLHLDHLCRVRSCCNPQHLEPVTNRENWLRGQHHVAVMLRENKCQRGHEMTPENTYIKKSGGRLCRECVLISNREWRRNHELRPEQRRRKSELQRERRRARREASAA